MKLVRYGNSGEEKPGMIDADGAVRDLSAVVSNISGDVLSASGINELRNIDPSSLPLVSGAPQTELRLGPCVGNVGKFICIGLNYADHAAESGLEIPPEPVIFNKWTSAITGPDDDIQIPRDSTKTDWEIELGVVIGNGGSYIDEANAMDHIAGFCVVNDVSEREFQIEKSGTWTKVKVVTPSGP